MQKEDVFSLLRKNRLYPIFIIVILTMPTRYFFYVQNTKLYFFILWRESLPLNPKPSNNGSSSTEKHKLFTESDSAYKIGYDRETRFSVQCLSSP